MDKGLKVAFAGTPEFAVPSLEAILRLGFTVPFVFTQPDRPAGRGQKLVESPVKKSALRHGIAVFQPEKMGENEALLMQTEQIDVLVVVAFGQIVPSSILQAPRLGCLNVHASLLPRWRGASPIVQAILAGDLTTGVSLMKMDEGMDTGDVFKTHAVSVGLKTQGELHAELSETGAHCLSQVLPDLELWLSRAQVQSVEGVTYAPKIQKSHAQIDWTLTAHDVCRHVRAYNPAPMAFSFLGGLRCRIVSATPAIDYSGGFEPGAVVLVSKSGVVVSCGEGAIIIDRIQLPGCAVMNVRDHFNQCQDFFGGNHFRSAVD